MDKASWNISKICCKKRKSTFSTQMEAPIKVFRRFVLDKLERLLRVSRAPFLKIDSTPC
jgi:hypothetical protein